MNKYVVGIRHFFSGYDNFVVMANNKKEAIEKAKAKAKRFGSGNYDIEDIKFVKKINIKTKKKKVS